MEKKDSKVKLISIYYPQFHCIPVNDTAWGNGFTDWENVKKATPLFKGHYQPRIPMAKNYYDLSDPQHIKKQIDEAKKYGLDGFCFYHYWFDGKLLLEKPLELFLADKSIDFNFCLSWANETWTKRWTGDSKTIIQEQKHTPSELIWEKHFNYLLKFFKDDRYITIDNKPVFLIYQPIIIDKISRLLEFWQELAKKSGLEGIYFIATKRHDHLRSNVLNNFDGVMKFQPQEVYNSSDFSERGIIQRKILDKFRFLPEKYIDFLHFYKSKMQSYRIFDSHKIWKLLLKNAYKEIPDFEGDVFESFYANWDNTPRYGKKATIFSFINASEFKEYYKTLRNKATEKSSEFIFFNAWNEWAEGAYIEPDEKYGYDYLEAIYEVSQESIVK